MFNSEFDLSEFIDGIKLFDKTDNDPNILYDMQAYIFIGVIAVAIVLLIGLVVACMKRGEKKTKLRNLFSKIISNFFFNGIIRTITLMYIKLCIAVGAIYRQILF